MEVVKETLTKEEVKRRWRTGVESPLRTSRILWKGRATLKSTREIFGRIMEGSWGTNF